MDFTDDEHVKRIEFTQKDLAAFEDILRSSKNRSLPQFWQNKYRKDQSKNWDLFYKRNQANFFKDRSWLNREFGLDVLARVNDACGEQRWKLVDIGCGVGNATFPLLKEFPQIDVYAFDVSNEAIKLATERYLSDFKTPNAEEQSGECSPRETGRLMKLGVWDLILEDAPSSCWSISDGDVLRECEFGEMGSMDAGLLLFVLSAIPRENVARVIRKIGRSIRAGGYLLFRDYGRYDQKEIRFAERAESKLEDHFYVRQDGTLAVYFDKAELDDLFVQEGGFEILQSQYITRQFVNRKTHQTLNRCWIQAIYRKRVEGEFVDSAKRHPSTD